jgi:hypothetical protein
MIQTAVEVLFRNFQFFSLDMTQCQVYINNHDHVFDGLTILDHAGRGSFQDFSDLTNLFSYIFLYHF